MIIGYSNTDHLMLDLDLCAPHSVRGLARTIIREWPEVGNCLIMRTWTTSIPRDQVPRFHTFRGIHLSLGNFHQIYGGMIGRDKVFSILDCLAKLGVLDETYIAVRRDRGDMTLRVSSIDMLDRVRGLPEYYDYIVNSAVPFGVEGIERYLRVARLFRR